MAIGILVVPTENRWLKDLDRFRQEISQSRLPLPWQGRSTRSGSGRGSIVDLPPLQVVGHVAFCTDMLCLPHFSIDQPGGHFSFTGDAPCANHFFVDYQSRCPKDGILFDLSPVSHLDYFCLHAHRHYYFAGNLQPFYNFHNLNQELLLSASMAS